MSPARRTTFVVAALVIGFGLVGLVAWRAVSDPSDDPPSAPRLGDIGSPNTASSGGVVSDVVAATGPFEKLTAGTIRVGDRDVLVVVADSEVERSTGLRGRADASPYPGMLFVFDADTRSAFTMAGVPAPLDIGFYASDGTRVGRLRMEPCAGTDATCPIYPPSAPFRFALETAPGALPAGSLRVR